MMRIRTIFTLTAVVAVALLGGCSTPASSSPAAAADDVKVFIQAGVDCLKEKGWDVSELRPDETGPLPWTYDVVGIEDFDQAEITQFADDTVACFPQAELGEAMASHTAGMLLTGEEWQAEYQVFVDCLADAGVTVAVGAPWSEVYEAAKGNPEATTCLTTHQYRLFPATEVHGVTG